MQPCARRGLRTALVTGGDAGVVNHSHQTIAHSSPVTAGGPGSPAGAATALPSSVTVS